MPAANSVVGGRLHDLLPDLLNALSERFECVECEVERSPDLSAGPFRLPVGRVGSQLCVISKAECAEVAAAISSHLAGGRSLGTIQGRHVLTTDDSAALGLRLRLKNATATPIDRSLWRPAARDCVADGAKAEVSLLADEAPVLPATTINVLDIWLFPATKPKKRIRRVVKSTNPDGTPKKTLVSTKTVVENGGLKKIKKVIVDKSSPKENSPDVVQEVVEDPSNVSFLVRMGQPANGVDPAPTSNGVAHPAVANGKPEQNGAMSQPNGKAEIRPRGPDLPIVDQTRPVASRRPPPPLPLLRRPKRLNKPKIPAAETKPQATNPTRTARRGGRKHLVVFQVDHPVARRVHVPREFELVDRIDGLRARRLDRPAHHQRSDAVEGGRATECFRSAVHFALRSDRHAAPHRCFQSP
ncbi:hypothetical protein M3Y99_01162000 [Aphelenchoides fujianensis]|nr:hypothetical protein M3Y99_01162000 [Aphelenchoides fujianensis]